MKVVGFNSKVELMVGKSYLCESVTSINLAMELAKKYATFDESYVVILQKGTVVNLYVGGKDTDSLQVWSFIPENLVEPVFYPICQLSKALEIENGTVFVNNLSSGDIEVSYNDGQEGFFLDSERSNSVRELLKEFLNCIPVKVSDLSFPAKLYMYDDELPIICYYIEDSRGCHVVFDFEFKHQWVSKIGKTYGEIKEVL